MTAAVEAPELQVGAREGPLVGAVSHTEREVTRRAGHEADVDGDEAVPLEIASRRDLRAPEIGTAGERVLQVEELARVEGLAGVERHVPFRETGLERGLLEFDGSEVASLVRVEVSTAPADVAESVDVPREYPSRA